MELLQLKPLTHLLTEIINSTDSPHGYIYLQGDYPWHKDSPGLIYYTDRYDQKMLETEFPDFFRENSLNQVMQVDRAEDAIRNAFNQKPSPTWEELVDCFNFHYRNSGYLTLS